MDDRGVEILGEGIEPVDPPIGILAGQPGRHEPGFQLGWDAGAGMRQADQQRRAAATDRQPSGSLGHRPLQMRVWSGL